MDGTPHDLPPCWTWCSLGEIVELEYGKSLPSNKRNDAGKYPVFGSSGCVGNHSESIADGPCIIVGRKGSAGAVWFSKEDCWPIDTTYFVRTCDDLDIRFVFFLLKFLRLADLDRSTAIPGLNRDDAYAKQVSLPPLNEQRRIVEKIETLFVQLDKGEEALREVQRLLTRYRQSVLKAAVTGQLTEDWRADNSAAKWYSAEVGELVEFLTSGSRGWAKYYSSSGALFIRAQNLKHDRLDLDNAAHVSPPKKSEGTRTLVKRGDILITITGANVTRTALVVAELGEAYVSQHVGLLRLTGESDPEFIYWFLVAKAGGRKQLEKFAYGAGKPGLSLTNIREVKLTLPSLPEQKEIVLRVQEESARISMVEDLCHAELARSSALRQSILKDAFTGRLVPQDPTDEPAAALLSRIRETRGGAPGKKKRKPERKTRK